MESFGKVVLEFDNVISSQGKEEGVNIGVGEDGERHFQSSIVSTCGMGFALFC